MTGIVTPEGTGHRNNLTPFQQRVLFRLWNRFFTLCRTPAGFLGTDATGLGASASARGSQGNSVSSLGGNSAHSGSATTSERRSRFSNLRGKNSGGGGGGVGAAAAAAAAQAEAEARARASLATSRGGVASASVGSFSAMSRVRSVASIDEHAGPIPKGDGVKDELRGLEEAKEMREFLNRHGGERLREVFWEMVKGDHPDAVMLRFLRARKWDIDRAIAVIGSTAAFRVEHNIEGMLEGGEVELIKTRGGRNIVEKGSSYILGASPKGEPLYVIEVGNHFSHNQTQEEIKRGLLLIQEWLSLLMPPPVEQKVVIFNMSNFSLRNMDWWTVFFMVKTMESYYVETLARVYVHGAPWIFKPIWAILKPLLDPVTREKVRLTNRTEELAEHVPYDRVPKGLGGGLDWEFSYKEPKPTAPGAERDGEKKAQLQRERERLAAHFEVATRRVARLYAAQAGRDGAHQDESDFEGSDEEPDEMAELKAQRDVLATRLRVSFLRLAPHVLGNTRWLDEGQYRWDGSVHWSYDGVDGSHEEQHLGDATTLQALEAALAAIDGAGKASTPAEAAAAADENDSAAPAAGAGSSPRQGGGGGQVRSQSSGSLTKLTRSRPGTRGSRGMSEVLNENNVGAEATTAAAAAAADDDDKEARAGADERRGGNDGTVAGGGATTSGDAKAASAARGVGRGEPIASEPAVARGAAAGRQVDHEGRDGDGSHGGGDRPRGE